MPAKHLDNWRKPMRPAIATKFIAIAAAAAAALPAFVAPTLASAQGYAPPGVSYRADPCRVSCRTRLPRICATSGGNLPMPGPYRSTLFSRTASAAVCASDAVSEMV